MTSRSRALSRSSPGSVASSAGAVGAAPAAAKASSTNPASRGLKTTSPSATREALVNVAKHSGVTAADLYTEVTPDRVSVFVRDRGAGFDADLVPSDRRGLRDSVTGRITRLGGTALIRSAPGEGTEVELALPRAASS